MSPRPYAQRRRAENAEATRHRIVEATATLLRETDFHRVSVDEVAKCAGVGRTTVFQRFGSKAGLLRAVQEEISARAGVDRLLHELGDPDALVALRVAFELGCGVWAAERELFRKLFGLAVIDPEMRAVMREKDAGRYALVDQLVARLRRQKHLRASCPPRKASDLLRVLTAFETFDALYERRPNSATVAAMLLEIANAVIVE